MRQSERDKRTYLIIGLCAVLVVMAVGFAAFSQQLQINGTSNITSNWNVQITGITRFASSGAGVSDEADTPTYDNSNGLTATFSTRLTSPGDWATYKIKVENLGSLNAVLSSIDMQAGTSNDITYYVNKNQNNENITDTDRLIKENDVLKPTGDSSNLDEGYVYVTVKYNSYTGQTSPTGDNRAVSATVKLNFVQSNSEATPPVPTATTVYYLQDTTGHNIGDVLDTTGLTPDTIPLEQNYLKYVLNSSNQIIEASACITFDISGVEPVCLKGSNDGSTFEANKTILTTLSNNTTFTSNFGSCDITYLTKWGCSYQKYNSNYSSISANADGGVSSGENGNFMYCFVFDEESANMTGRTEDAVCSPV